MEEGVMMLESPLQLVPTIVNVLLAALTGTYVYLTYGLLKVSRAAIDQTRALAEQQLVSATTPHIHISVNGHEGSLWMTLMNPSSLAAFDIDLLFVGTYDKDSTNFEQFVENYVSPTGRKGLDPDEEGFFGLYDHLTYAVVPQRRTVTAKLQFPEIPPMVSCLLQFRGVTGMNYFHAYWLMSPDYENPEGNFRIGALDPDIWKASPRISYDWDFEVKKRVLKAERGKLPEEICRNFLSSFRRSIPVGYLKTGPLDVEDRGSWKELG